MTGMLFAGGRRTVTTWLRAAGVSDDFQDYYYFLAALGRKSESISTQLVALLLRVLPCVEAGQGLVVVEAMKMENEVPAPETGRIKSINVQTGQSVAGGGVLLVVE